MKRRFIGLVTMCSAFLSAPHGALGQSPPTSVALGNVEAGVVRVFSVQNVAVEEERTERGMRIVAIPRMGHGTGFSVAGDDRIILTAAHVVDDASYVVVRLPGNGAYFPARVAYRDDERDVAVLMIEGTVPPLELQPAAHLLRTRQNVFTVGYPLDASRSQAQSSRGIVGGALDDGQLQLDMAVNPGNSGGPVIDEQDRVVGMVVARGDVERGVQGLAVAVPLATLHDAVAQARARIRDGRVAPLPSDAERAATVIDTLSRVGLMRVLREARDVTEGTTDTQAIQAIRALNDDALSPDMRVFVAAFLWDAAQMLMHRAGGHITPTTMSAGATRTLAEALLEEARLLLRSAAERDPTVADRSPFVRVSTGGAPAIVSSEALRAFTDAFPVASARPLPAVPEANWRWQSRRSWALMVGAGFGMAGYFGGDDDRDEYSLVDPTGPGVGIRVFMALRIATSSSFSLVVEGDFLAVIGARYAEDTTPSTYGDFDLDTDAASRGGAVALIPRLHPGGSILFIAPMLRVGAQRYARDSFRSDDGPKRFLMIQPGLDVGLQLPSLDLSLRFLAGVPQEDKSAGLYTLMLNISTALIGGDL